MNTDNEFKELDDALMAKIEGLNWQKQGDLIPSIVQDNRSGQVLMLGYVNKESLMQSLLTKKLSFFSRTRERIWQKGETSGNFLHIVDWFPDCDQDAILFLVEPQGPTCHQGTSSCFGEKIGGDWNLIERLESVLRERSRLLPEQSYTSFLIHSGVKRIAQKLGEESLETALAAVAGDETELDNESADLVYHLLVLLFARGRRWEDVLEILRKRRK